MHISAAVFTPCIYLQYFVLLYSSINQQLYIFYSTPSCNCGLVQFFFNLLVHNTHHCRLWYTYMRNHWPVHINRSNTRYSRIWKCSNDIPSFSITPMHVFCSYHNKSFVPQDLTTCFREVLHHYLVNISSKGLFMDQLTSFCIVQFP